MNDASIFDRPSLLRRVMDDEELIAELLKEFIKDIPQRLDELRQALDSERLDLDARRTICYQSHTIKGAAAGISALALSEAARILCDEGGTGERAVLRQMAFDVALEFDRFRDYISGQRDGKAAG